MNNLKPPSQHELIKQQIDVWIDELKKLHKNKLLSKCQCTIRSNELFLRFYTDINLLIASDQFTTVGYPNGLAQHCPRNESDAIQAVEFLNFLEEVRDYYILHVVEDLKGIEKFRQWLCDVMPPCQEVSFQSQTA